MKTVAVVLMMLISLEASAQSVENGKSLFNANCKACHSIGKGRLVGPDLKGLTDRRSEEWIKSFIANSAALIESGDQEAIAIFNEYNKIAMPAHPFNEEQLSDLVTYIKNENVAPEVVLVSQDVEQENEVPGQEQQLVSSLDVVPLWAKIFLGGTLSVAILLLGVIIFLLKFIRGM